MDTAQEGLYRLRRLLQRHMALTSLLIQGAKVRMQLFQPVDGRKRRRYIAEHPLGERTQVEEVPILGHRGQLRLGSAQSLCEPSLLDEVADSLDFEFDGCGLAHGRAEP